MSPTPPPGRGAGWVWAQGILMSALVVAGPAFPAAWHAPAAVAAGAALMALSGALGIAGVVQLGRNRTPFPEPRPGSSLVEHGVYAWVRHPLYASVLGAGLGWALLWQHLPVVFLATAQVPFFAAKARSEERRLLAAFPGYAAYARRVKRFLPGVF